MKRSSPSARNSNGLMRRSAAAATLVCALVMSYYVAASQNVSDPTLKGETGKVILVPNNTVNAGEIKFKADTDNDGMSDEDEADNGTDPNDSSDADADNDGDGLSNGDEVAMKSAVNNADSDGDGVSDGEEARLGYNPSDPRNTPPVNTTVVSLRLAPDPLELSLNTLLGSQPTRLRVTGVLSNGVTVDLTNAPGITYQSQNESVALVDDSGTAAGVTTGTTTIVVTKDGLTAQVPVNVSVFTPVGLSKISVPGYANSVAVQGSYAYIASGAAGLLIVDVSNRRVPRIVGTLDTPGNADDVKVAGDLAYVADGVAGLAVVNVSDRTNPRLLGSVDTPGEAQDLAVQGTLVYIADGASGLQIVNVVDPTNPRLAGALATPSTARGVDVSGDLAVVVGGSSGLLVIGVAQPQNPTLVGQLLIGGDIRDVVVHDSYAYVSATFNGLGIISLAVPSAPQVVSFDSTFAVRDVAIAGTYAFVPFMQLTPVGTPIVAINDPTRPNWRGMVDFSAVGIGVGLGVAVDEQYVFTTVAESGESVTQNGASGLTALFIGRYQPRFDRAGVAPSVSLVTPQEGQEVLEGNPLIISANASDDVEVESVQFSVNGEVVATDFTFPYEAVYSVPANGGGGPPTSTDSTVVSVAQSGPSQGTLTVTAVATDLGGNSSASAPVNVVLIPQQPPAVALVSPPEGATLYEGQTVDLVAQPTDPANVSRVVFTVNGGVFPQDRDAPFRMPYTVPAGVGSLSVTATATYFDATTATVTRTFDVAPPAPTTVTGRVVDFSNQPVAGASVTVFGEFAAQSAADGTFVIPGVPITRGPVSANATAVVDGRQLGGASLAVAPAPGATTNVGNVLLQDVHYETDIGSLLNFNTTRLDDVAVAVALPFPFTYYGTTHTQVFVGSNGYLTFGSGDTTFNETEARFAQGRPRIAPLFDDWFPDQKPDEGVYYNAQLPGRVVFTWRGVGHAANHGNREVNDTANFQVVLFDDGRIQFGYGEVGTLGGLTGISPGGTPQKIPFNFTAAPAFASPTGSFSFGQDSALYEQFLGIGPFPFDLKHAFITYTPQPFGGYEMKFYRAPQTTVTGRLTDAAGNPVGGATVSVRSLSATTEADGTFVIQKVPADEPFALRAVWVAPDGRLSQVSSAPTQPAAAGTTDFGTLALAARGRAFETDFGMAVQHASGSFPKIAFQLPFQFRFYGQSFYGQTFDRVYINPTGHLSLSEFCAKSGCNDRFGLTNSSINDVIFAFSNTPIIAPLLTDLDPGNTGQVFVRSTPDEWVMTFVNVQRPGLPGTNTFQVVLRPDGTIRFAYNGVSNTYGHVGLSPGVFWGMSEDEYSVDWSTTRATGMPNAYPFFEMFTGELGAPGSSRNFDLDRNVLVFFPNDDGSYDVVRQQLVAPAAQSRIVFEGSVDGESDLYAVDPDGRNLDNLTNSRGDDYNAVFSPDRTKIAFDSYRDDPTGQSEEVYVMNPDGTGLVKLTNNPADDFDPSWSPDGTKILFLSNRNGGSYESFVMNADGSEQRKLTGHPGDRSALWSPDGSKILFESDRGGDVRLYVMNADGSNQTPLNGAGNFGGNPDSFAAWSPDGSRIAFQSYRNGEADVFVVNADGTGLVNLTNHPSADFIPKWSPDGSKILFSSNRDSANGMLDLYAMNADGTGVVRLSTSGAFIGHWSPDGTRVAYITEVSTNAIAIWVVNADGTDPRQIVNNRSPNFVDDWNIVP